MIHMYFANLLNVRNVIRENVRFTRPCWTTLVGKVIEENVGFIVQCRLPS